MGLEGEKQHI